MWEWLDHAAPFALLAHDASDDPRFIYANRTALRLFEYSWDELIGTPSRFTTLPGEDRDERARLFASLELRDFFAGYRGRRITGTRDTFWIDDAVIWNVRQPDGERIAQAAIITRHSKKQP